MATSSRTQPLKDRLIALAASFLAGSCSDVELVSATTTLEKAWLEIGRDGGVAGGGDARELSHYNFQLLLKRLERTCKRHFCALWNECKRGCQYADGPGWKDTMKTWEAPVELPRA